MDAPPSTDLETEVDERAAALNGQVVSLALHIINVCQPYGGAERCRYLCETTWGMYKMGFYCARGTHLESRIDEEVAYYLGSQGYLDRVPQEPIAINCDGRRI